MADKRTPRSKSTSQASSTRATPKTTTKSSTQTTRRSSSRKPRSSERRPAQRSDFFVRFQEMLFNPEARQKMRDQLPSWSDEFGGITLIVIGVLTFASLLNPSGEGALSTPIASSLAQIFGWGGFLVSAIVSGFGIVLLLPKAGVHLRFSAMRILGIELLIVTTEGLLHLLTFTTQPRAVARAGEGGGYVGWAIGSVITSVVGQWPSIMILSVILLYSLFLISGITRSEVRRFFLALSTQLEQTADRLQDGARKPIRRSTVDAQPLPMVDATKPPKPRAGNSEVNQTQAAYTMEVEKPSPTLNQWHGTPPAFRVGETGMVAAMPSANPQLEPPTTRPIGAVAPHLDTQNLNLLSGSPDFPTDVPLYSLSRSTFSEDVLSELNSSNPGSLNGHGDQPQEIEYKTLVINGEVVHIPINSRDNVAEGFSAPTPISEAQRRRTEGRRYFTVDGFHDRYVWSDERDMMLPPLELLNYADLKLPDEEEINTNARIIENTMSEFDVNADVIDVRIGPTVTQYAVSPIKEVVNEKGEVEIIRTRVSKIANLSSDLALALSTKRLRIQAPVPGYSYVGIEVPNREPSLVSMRGVMETEAFYRKRSHRLMVPLGRDVSGDAVITDLASLPHLLIAGTTGSGKSVCLTSIIAALVVNNNPTDVRIILLDPKMVELTRFNNIPHLLGPVETETERIIGVLRWAAREMDRRYKLLELENARNLESYNALMGEDRKEEKLPYIVIVIDEIGDLMMTRPDETEKTVTRLAQKARAAGMHLIIATQRPSVDVITGLIKANFPARISFSVASGMDSRVILDSTGAETLIGKGDMLFLAPDAAGPQRLQGCFISDEEIYEILMYWQAWEQEMIAEGQLIKADMRVSPWETSMTRLEQLTQLDPMLEDALQMVVADGRASVSQIQKGMGIDYPRAARLMDSLRDLGIVGGTMSGGLNRKVLVKSVEEARRLIHNNKRMNP